MLYNKVIKHLIHHQGLHRHGHEVVPKYIQHSIQIELSVSKCNFTHILYSIFLPVRFRHII
jgi:hypothetical protein